MLELAKQLTSGEPGIVATARALVPFRDEVGATEPEIGALLEIFAGLDSETDAFPLGEVRQYWSPASLERGNSKLAAAERSWRERAMDAGSQLVRLLEGPLD